MTSASIESLTARADFQATSDPAVAPSQELLTYRELYELWERQRPAQPDVLRDDGVEELLRRVVPQRLQHRLRFVGARPDVTGHEPVGR